MDAVQRVSASNNRRITGRTLLGWKVSRGRARVRRPLDCPEPLALQERGRRAHHRRVVVP